MIIVPNFPGGGVNHTDSSGLEKDELKAGLFNEYERLFIELIQYVDSHDSKLAALGSSASSVLELLGDVTIGTASTNFLDINSTTRFNGPVEGLESIYINATNDLLNRNLDDAIRIGTTYPANFDATVLKMSDGITTIESAINSLGGDIWATNVLFDNASVNYYLTGDSEVQSALQTIDSTLGSFAQQLTGISYTGAFTQIEQDLVIFDTIAKITLSTSGNIDLIGNINLQSGSTVDGIDVSDHSHDGTPGMGEKIYSANVTYAASIPMGGGTIYLASEWDSVDNTSDALDTLYSKMTKDSGGYPVWADEWTGSDIPVSSTDSRTIAEVLSSGTGGGFNYVSVTPTTYSNWKGMEAYGDHASDPSLQPSAIHVGDDLYIATFQPNASGNNGVTIRGTTVRPSNDGDDNSSQRDIQIPSIWVEHADFPAGPWETSSTTSEVKVGAVNVYRPLEGTNTNDMLCYWEFDFAILDPGITNKYIKIKSDNGTIASEVIQLSLITTGPIVVSINAGNYYPAIPIPAKYNTTGDIIPTSTYDGRVVDFEVIVQESGGIPIEGVYIEAKSLGQTLFDETYITEGIRNMIALSKDLGYSGAPGEEKWMVSLTVANAPTNQYPITIYCKDSLGTITDKLFGLGTEQLYIEQEGVSLSSLTVNYPEYPGPGSGVYQQAYRNTQTIANGLQVQFTNFLGTPSDYIAFESNAFVITNPNEATNATGVNDKEILANYPGNESPETGTIQIYILKASSGKEVSFSADIFVDNNAPNISSATIDDGTYIDSAGTSTYKNLSKLLTIQVIFDDDLLEKPVFEVFSNSYSKTINPTNILGSEDTYTFIILDNNFLDNEIIKLRWDAVNTAGIAQTAQEYTLFINDKTNPIITSINVSPTSSLGDYKVLMKSGSFDPSLYPDYVDDLVVTAKIVEASVREVRCKVPELGIDAAMTNIGGNQYQFIASNASYSASFFRLDVEIEVIDTAGNITSDVSGTYGQKLSYDQLGTGSERSLVTSAATGILKDFTDANAANVAIYEVWDTEARYDYTNMSSLWPNNSVIILENKARVPLTANTDDYWLQTKAFVVDANLEQNYQDYALRLPILVIKGFEESDGSPTATVMGDYTLTNYMTSSGNPSRLEIYVSGSGDQWVLLDQPTGGSDSNYMKSDGLTLKLEDINNELENLGSSSDRITTEVYFKIKFVGDALNPGNYPRIDSINMIYYRP